MFAPNASHHYPDPSYLRTLLSTAQLTQSKAADLIGISPRLLRYYLSSPSSNGYRQAPYPVQYALEALAWIHESGKEAVVLKCFMRD